MTEMVQKVRQKTDLEAQKMELLQEKKRLEEEVFSHKITAHNEQADVENLEGFSMEGLLLKMTGRYEEKLEEERREARAARSRCEFSVARLENITLQLTQIEQALSDLVECEDILSTALQERLGRNPCAEEEALTRALEAAVKTGTALEDAAKALQSALDTAQSWLGTKPGMYAAVGEMRQAELRAQEQLNAYIEILDVLQQQLAELGYSLDIQQPGEFGRDYLLGILTGFVVSNRYLIVQQQLVRIARQWHNLKSTLLDRLRNARIAWMHALCCAGKA